MQMGKSLKVTEKLAVQEKAGRGKEAGEKERRRYSSSNHKTEKRKSR